MRRLALVPIVVLAALIAAPGSAGAATQVGQTFVPTDNCGPRTRLQSSSPGGQYAAPFAGVITSWSFQASSAGGEGPVTLKVGRHASGDQFAIVGESEVQAIPDLDVLKTFPTRIAVSAGDVIGLYTAPASVFYCARPTMGAVVHQSAFAVNVALGPPAMFSPVIDRQLGVSAALEPDCDQDGFGDESQDPDTSSCPTCHGKPATISGTGGADKLSGTPAADVIAGAGGNDRLSGKAGNDFICGGSGKDTLKGGKGKDQLYGELGKDKLKGGPGKDKQVQ